MDEARLGLQIGEVQADRSRLEQGPLIVLEDGDPCERMASAVLVALALLPAHDRQLVGLTELLEHPCDPNRASGVLAVKDAQHQPGRYLSSAPGSRQGR